MDMSMKTMDIKGKGMGEVVTEQGKQKFTTQH